MEPLSTQIRNLIRAEMEIRGLSIRDLAKLLGCTKENVDQILRIREREGKGMKTVIADQIFKVLGLEVSATIKEKQEREAVIRFLRQKDRHGNLSTYCETLALIFESGQHRREDVNSLSSEDLLMNSK